MMDLDLMGSGAIWLGISDGAGGFLFEIDRFARC
jgi:hypothetical protein